MQPSVAIVGYGSLGRALGKLFPDAAIYDEPLGMGSREAVNAARFALVAVPTPATANGACDTSIVESVVGWIESACIIIVSTIEVGTTERLVRTYGKVIVHQPHYGPGDTPGHPFSDLRNQDWVILGGERAHTAQAVELYKRAYGAEVEIWQTDARTAELAKYMENAFLALKVAFCNEMFDVAGATGVDYTELRELWLRDPRIGRSHTLVYPDDRGYGGKCLPKDVSALINTAREHGAEPLLLSAMVKANERMRSAQQSLDGDKPAPRRQGGPGA
jgi:UDPglucose 6-dehydrogenase